MCSNAVTALALILASTRAELVNFFLFSKITRKKEVNNASNLQAILASSPTVTTLLQYFVTSNMAELGEMVIRKSRATKTIFILSKFSSSVNGKNSGEEMRRLSTLHSR